MGLAVTLAQELIETKALLEAERSDRDDARAKCDELRAIIRDGLDLFFEGGEWAPVVQRAQAALSDAPRTPQVPPNTKGTDQ